MKRKPQEEIENNESDSPACKQSTQRSSLPEKETSCHTNTVDCSSATPLGAVVSGRETLGQTSSGAILPQDPSYIEPSKKPTLEDGGQNLNCITMSGSTTCQATSTGECQRDENQKPDTQEQDLDFDIDIEGLSSLEVIRIKIDFVWKLLFSLESTSSSTNIKPPFPSRKSTPLTDEMFIAWCYAHSRVSYKKKLFEIIEQLRQEEKSLMMDDNNSGSDAESESNDNYSTHSDDSSWRDHLRAKIDSVKRDFIKYRVQNAEAKSSLELPAKYSDMDLDVFLIHCFKSKDYATSQRSQVYAQKKEQIGSRASNTTLEEEIGRLLENLVAEAKKWT
ncbi:hypothetical protein BGX27_009782 [Mortierella sp. AM989]|nr:hypothetical protein BGX27_009782 [Mortierella sp. AM989]